MMHAMIDITICTNASKYSQIYILNWLYFNQYQSKLHQYKSKYEDACVTCEEDIVVVNKMTDIIDLPNLFGLMDVRASRSSSGKCCDYI